MKVCSRCKTAKPVTEYYKRSLSSDGLSPHCKGCHKGVSRKSHLKLTYGLTVEQFESMLSTQGNRCLICSDRFKEQRGMGPKAACVDHCHTTGKVRGLLCDQCNKGLGNFRDNPAFLLDAIQYLTRTQHDTDSSSA